MNHEGRLETVKDGQFYIWTIPGANWQIGQRCGCLYRHIGETICREHAEMLCAALNEKEGKS